MDKSHEYIKMCKEASEIQDHKSEPGDFYSDGCYIYVLGTTHENNIHGKGYTWLPRQDQLQELLDKTSSSICYCNACLLTYLLRLAEEIDEETEKEISFENLWLRFLMKNNYEKGWNGKEWERIFVNI